jgi:hypothetical protein
MFNAIDLPRAPFIDTSAAVRQWEHDFHDIVSQ